MTSPMANSATLVALAQSNRRTAQTAYRTNRYSTRLIALLKMLAARPDPAAATRAPAQTPISNIAFAIDDLPSAAAHAARSSTYTFGNSDWVQRPRRI